MDEFDFSTEHLPGHQNHVADTLSLHSCETTLINLQAEDGTYQTIKVNILSRQNTCEFAAGDLKVVVVPAKIQQQVLEIVHDASDHMDASRTLNKLKDRYLWPNMATTAIDYANACQVCQLYNRPATWSAGRLCFMPTSEIPLSSIALDHIMTPPTDDK